MKTQATIWVVDDEPDLLDAVGTLLVEAGFNYRGFEDPRLVLEALETDAPDLFVIDLNMPHLTGVELIKMLRRRTNTGQIPILVLTALTSDGALLNAFKAGADDVVRKPFSLSEMLARISAQLGRVRQIKDLRRENEDLTLITRVAQVLSQDDDLPSLLRILIDCVKTALPVARCSVYLVDPESGDLHRALPSDPSRSEGSPNITLDLRGLPHVSDPLAARAPAFLDAKATTLLLDKMGGVSPTQAPYHSAAVFPMQLKNTLVGILVLVSPEPRVGQDARERSIASIVSDFGAVAVHRSELFASIRNEHERMNQVARDLTRARDFLEGVVESSPDAVVASTIDGKVLLLNGTAERVLGWKRGELMGRDVRLLYPDGGAERIMHLIRSDRFGGGGRLEPNRETLMDREGNEIPVEISASIIYDEAGEEVATVGVFTDLRGRLKMEERLQEATENLERTRRQAVAAELAGAAAHELNQPLTSLLGYAELLRKRVEDDDENRKPVEKVYSEAKRIADIVRKIGRITDYKTKEYVGGIHIVDLDQSSEVEELGPEESLERSRETSEFDRSTLQLEEDSIP